MIEAPTPCFFTGFLRDEAAQFMMQDLFPSVASDIEEISIISEDFDTDIEALVGLDDTAGRIKMLVASDVDISEKFNPLFIPQTLDAVDEVLESNMKNDHLKFVAFNGNPFTLKHVEMKKNDVHLVTFQAQFHPFDLPAYSEIISSYEQFLPN